MLWSGTRAFGILLGGQLDQDCFKEMEGRYGSRRIMFGRIYDKFVYRNQFVDIHP